MIQLPNACYCSSLKVHPKNWDKPGASTKNPWYIHYRFHDPAFKDQPKFKYGFLRILKGMNGETALSERRFLVRRKIEMELTLLQQKGYNPITGTCIEPAEYNFDVTPSTPFIKALKIALEKCHGVHGTLADMQCVINGVEQSALQLRIHDLPIGQITRKYIKIILEQCGKNNKRWSGHRHNKYRAYLMKLFKELIQLEAVDINPVRDIVKATEIKRDRVMPTLKDRRIIDECLKASHYPFWRAVQIFFYSGSRETELMRVQGKDIDLVDQSFKCTVKKGPIIREVRKPIRDMALPLWTEIMVTCGPEDYIFSKGLLPGPDPIRTDQICRRWKRIVKDAKKGLGINVDLYTFKHIHTTESMDELERTNRYSPENEKVIANMNGHTSTAMVVKIYDIKNQKRKDDRIKGLRNTFS